MSERKWTPGPWYRHTDTGEMGIGHGDINDYGSPEKQVVNGCGCCGSPFGVSDSEECDANAHLIAAAPELYEALEEIYEMLDYDKNSKRYEDACMMAEAALAKARGEK